LKIAFEKWQAAGQDPQRFRSATVVYEYKGRRNTDRAWKALR